MKKAKIIILLCFLILFSNYALAGSSGPTVYQYDIPEVTVVFPSSVEIPINIQNRIADELAGIGISSSLPCKSGENPDNILCTLFGHKFSSPVSVTATHHKVRQYDPRCILELYHVLYCTRCDYTESQLVASSYISCCPED